MEIEIKTKITIRPEYLPLFYIVAGRLDCTGDDAINCLISKLEKRETEDKKSLVSNSLYSHFGDGQVEIANNAISLLDGAVESTVTISDTQ